MLPRTHDVELLGLRNVVGNEVLHGILAHMARRQDGGLKSIFHFRQIRIIRLDDVVDERGHRDGS